PPVCSEKRATAKWCSAACSRWHAISTSFAANFATHRRSAGLQRKESHGKVVFGSVQSVARNLDQFRSEFR
ncbi:hypothetical protein CJ430_31650, partial [Klebsiella pneumoniae]